METKLDVLPPEVYVLLSKDDKPICRTRIIRQPFLSHHVNFSWNIAGFPKNIQTRNLPHFQIFPEPEDTHQAKEWKRFLSFLQVNNLVAHVKDEFYDFYVLSPCKEDTCSHAKVFYKKKQPESSSTSKKNTSNFKSIPHNSSTSQPLTTTRDRYLESTVRVDPTYLLTLGQAHASWCFGAIAELVDNSRDAKAKRLDISIQCVYSKNDGKKIPMLSVIDDGTGMGHADIVRMLSFGHKRPEIVGTDHIGRFGIGFKTGAMKLGKDALILTQTSESRSVAFLSQSLNEKKENVEIPIVTYCKQGHLMEVDISIQSEACASLHLKAIKDHSPFNEYFIGEKLGLFGENGSGTQIYIWNLEKWGSDYTLEWEGGDILVRNKRVRSRPGQLTKKVPLDYSLQAYLAVIFLEPRMKIYVQGSQVRSRPMAKFLNNTKIVKGFVMGKHIELTLGRSQVEWEMVNCGLFLYWHGRLIEAYKRVGGMIYNADQRRGIIGVVDVSDVLSDDDGHVWVHNNKQSFLDCEAYVALEDWLGCRSDEYWDDNYDPVQLAQKKGSTNYKPDHEWVQCNKCRKWRILTGDFDSSSLPIEWFCYMVPFNGSCSIPEQELGQGVITVALKRSRNDSEEDSSQTDVEIPYKPILKRLRRGPKRKAKLER